MGNWRQTGLAGVESLRVYESEGKQSAFPRKEVSRAARVLTGRSRIVRRGGTAAPSATRRELERRRSSRCGLLAYAPPISSQAAGAATQLDGGAYMDLGSFAEPRWRALAASAANGPALFRRLESKLVDRPRSFALSRARTSRD